MIGEEGAETSRPIRLLLLKLTTDMLGCSGLLIPPRLLLGLQAWRSFLIATVIFMRSPTCVTPDTMDDFSV